MPKIIELSSHIANLIAAGEVVERPASAVKELLENAVDAGAAKVTVEIRDGGMTFLRITDDGCGMAPEDARMAFKRHATSKLRTEDDLAAISTMGFRGEALAAIASVSRIDVMTKPAGAVFGTSLHLEAGVVTEEEEAGCPEGTTIIVRDLFFNTPARMKFMKADTVEGGRVAGAVQMQALAHPEVAFTLIRDGKQVLSTPGRGGLEAAVYSVYGRECADMVQVDSRWEQYRLTGFVSKPTNARPSRNLQTFFVNGRPVKSKLLVAALEEAYRNQIMAGKFPACVLHLTLPANAVDVNVHPAKTEVKFLAERTVFECMHYGVLGALNQTRDRPQVQFRGEKTEEGSMERTAPVGTSQPAASTHPQSAMPQQKASGTKQENFFRTMTPQEYKTFASAVKEAPKPAAEAAKTVASRVAEMGRLQVREPVMVPAWEPPVSGSPRKQEVAQSPKPKQGAAPSQQEDPLPAEPAAAGQVSLTMPETEPWRLVGELYRSYILVEQGDEAFLIDKHAAHERILFDKLKANQERIASQQLLSPIPCRVSAEAAGELLSRGALLEELGFEITEFGPGTVLIRRIPMDLSAEDACDAVEALGADLLSGRKDSKDTVRDEVLHTVACKAAIKAGWKTDEQELLALVKQVMDREDLKYCPHGRPICITLTKKQLEKQFKRS